MTTSFSIFMDVLPHVPLDRGVLNVNTGVYLLDLLPLLTMLPCAPTLLLFWRKRRYADFAFFGLGFALAVIYHIAHLHGIHEFVWLGLPGSLWRSLDILCCQALLSRTVGHAVGAHSGVVVSLSNIVFPFLLMGWAFLSKRPDAGLPPLTLGKASRALLLVVLAALAAKFAFEGASTVPSYNRRRGQKAMVCFFLGFAFFPLPELAPGIYWFTHSVWHVFMAMGYWELYSELLEGQARQRAMLAERAAARKRAALNLDAVRLRLLSPSALTKLPNSTFSPPCAHKAA